jgi:hypothetical protein
MGRLSKVGAAFLCSSLVAGPVLLGLLTALYIGRPSPYFLATGITLAVAILACDGWIIARRHWMTGGFALATQIAFLIFVGTYTASPHRLAMRHRRARPATACALCKAELQWLRNAN